MKIKVIIIDNHTSFLEGMKSILETEETLEIVGLALSGKSLFELLKTSSVDVVLLDYQMPEMNGLQILLRLQEEYPELKSIILSGKNEAKLIDQMFKFGAKGYILKDSGKEVIVKGIQEVYQNKKFACPKTSSILFQKAIHKRPNSNQSVHLSNREKEVLSLLSDGMNSDEIAKKLGIKPHTVKHYRKALKRKIEAKNLADLIKYAIRNGYTKL